MCRRVVEMRDRHLLAVQFGNGFHRAATAKNVKWIEDDRAARMSCALDDIECQFNGVDLFDKAEELHGGKRAARFADLEKLTITLRAAICIPLPGRWSRDDISRAELGRLLEPPTAFRLD